MKDKISLIKSWIEKAKKDILTDYAVELRYPDISEVPTLENAKSAFLLAKECLALVSARIE